MIMEKIVVLLDTLFKIPVQQLAAIVVLFILLILCTLSAIVSITKLLTLRREQIVIKNSVYYSNVLELNKHTVYHHDIAQSGNVHYVMQVNSKAKFDKTEPTASLDEYLRLYSLEMRAYLQMVSDNRKAYRSYLSEFEGLSSTITREECRDLRINFDKFCTIERKLVDSAKLVMIQELSITCYVEYSSPQGMRCYSKDCTYLESEIRTAMQNLITREAYMRSEAWRRKNERSKVTPSLRYNVMHRDGFRCCLCGRSGSNGTELEVDHIVPVSKGGNTTYSNLQTLCRECNRGKGAKMLE